MAATDPGSPEEIQQRIRAYAEEHPTASESDIGWAMVKELSVEAAALLTDAFAEHGGRNGRLSVQTDPRLYRDGAVLVAQAVEFEAQRPAGQVQLARHLGQAAEGNPFEGDRMTAPQCVQVYAVAVIGGDHSQASEAAFGRLGLPDEGQAGLAAEI